ncbi:hypothetical protein FHS29_004502 [Saccharothrix tamanrassetensis]|uniref:Uncharacterized protein n=1 Tax=Saccharothrix tamanrassetensis TaxID=1051531 RepID=A0A841CNF1_9PSEU|nr:hypothetical protein [Saccharothrix tamanrassetensis]
MDDTAAAGIVAVPGRPGAGTRTVKGRTQR